MQTTKFLILILALSLCVASCSDDEPGFCTTTVNDLAGGVANIGTATLSRDVHSIDMTMDVDDLLPGYAYSAWWVIWNKPDNCAVPGKCSPNPDLGNAATEVELLYADGMVVGSDGKGIFSASLLEGAVSGSINELIGKTSVGGLQSALNSEIHLVLRSNGPEIAGKTSEQIGSFFGGCDTNFPGFSETPDAPGECGNVIAAVFSQSQDCLR